MLEELKTQVCQAQAKLAEMEFTTALCPSASAVDRAGGLMVVTPNERPNETVGPEQMPVVSLETGEVVEGDLAPSFCAPMHLELYRGFKQIGGIAHVHSLYATAWAQAARELPPMGITHSVHFHGAVPCTRHLVAEDASPDSEANVGKLIVERFVRLDPLNIPAILVAGHGPVAWGKSPAKAVDTARILEKLAALALTTVTIEPYPKPLVPEFLDMQFNRRHRRD